jgi:L-ascorbate metabolism protein UlaG (beta-lactamase superfamily)
MFKDQACFCLLLAVTLMLVFQVDAQELERDVIPTSEGDLEITFIGHGTLMLTVSDLVIHVDPWTRLADYASLPKADLILITHAHRDHTDPEAVAMLRGDATAVVTNPEAAEKIENTTVMRNGEERTYRGIKIVAVPAYNIKHHRDSGEPFHPKDRDNGYLLTIGDTRVYIAGDTENTPEMKQLEDVDVALLPMNLPYTMTPEMVADAARAMKPGILYPYHYGDTDPAKLVELLKDEPGIEVRIRSMR